MISKNRLFPGIKLKSPGIFESPGLFILHRAVGLNRRAEKK